MGNFDKVYPFTTESISGYINDMDVNNKSVLTVGSSLDQAFSCLLNGAKEVTVIDINSSTSKYYLFKREMILKSATRKELISNISRLYKEYDIPISEEEFFSLNDLTMMCPYLKSEETFNKMKEILKSKNINFITGSIFNLDNLTNELFDRIIFSNVLQYTDQFTDGDYNEFFKENMESWNNHLNDGGIIQLLYLYAYPSSELFGNYKLTNFINALSDYNLQIVKFASSNSSDAAIIYEKPKEKIEGKMI